MMQYRQLAALLLTAWLSACSSDLTRGPLDRNATANPSIPDAPGGSGNPSPPGNPSGPDSAGAAGAPSFSPTAEQARSYMQYIGPALLGRVLTDDEISRLDQQAGKAIEPMLRDWVGERGFAEAVRIMMELRLGTSGKRGDADYGLAGYLVRHVVQARLPWSTILTSSTCYDATDAPIPCDTGAPFTAGVLTTRGFLAGNESRFNLARAHAMLNTFMCRDYPHEEELQPKVERMQLKVMFRAATAEEQQEAAASGGFGNGFNCYTCHGQFSLHAQPFVKFDKSGLWQADATGLQSETGQLGDADNGLSASHWFSADLAKLESASWFTHPIANLAEGAQVLAQHPKFRECTLQHLLDLAISLDPAYDSGIQGLKVAPDFLTELATAVTAQEPDPTIQALAIALYADPRVMAATLNGLKR